MAATNPIGSSRIAGEGPAVSLSDCPPLARRLRARKLPTRHPIPAHRGPDGAASFRSGLAKHERAVIDAALAIIGSYLREPVEAIESPDAVKTYLRLQLAGERRELFAVMYLDAQNQVIAFEIPFTGTLTQTTTYPREIVRAALAHGAAAVILAHNHPSGRATPSRADEELTQTLKAALALVDVRVIDHVIVAGTKAISMAETGRM
ncbi:MAG: DNA repair protein RadC [Proteobacteria bacterium]|nr:DNA repair protein RadC [Pseudomonadota bacterium]